MEEIDDTGLAGRLSGPPLKDDFGRQRRNYHPWSGRTIVRPSIEGYL